MPRFLLRFKLEKKPNRARPDETLEKPRIVLGSRPFADVHVPDRLVPQEAMALEFDGKRLRIEVLGNLAGVFVDGVETSGIGVVPNGSAIQVGHALVEVAIDDAQEQCTLTVGEHYLRKTVADAAKKAQAAFALVQDGPQEQRWGRSPHLARWSWIAAALGGAAILAFPLLRETDAMSRGELHGSHAIGTPGGPEACSSCHEPFASDYGPACSKCHEGYASEGSHPYARASEFGCAHCHGEHRGASASLLPADRRGPDGWAATCSACHAGESAAAKSAAALADATLATRAKDRPADAEERWLLVDGFSHADHRVAKTRRIGLTGSADAPEGSVPLPCAECHARRTATGGPPAGGKGAEFAPVAYEKCLACHAEWRVEVHGRDRGGAHCFQCHVRTDDVARIPKDIRTVAAPATGSLYELPPRRHDFAKDDCRKCHVVEKAGPSRAAPVRVAFRHDHHLRTVDPPRGGELDLSATCVPCHKGVAGGDTLAGLGGALPTADLSGCAECHTDGAPKPVAPAAARAPRTVVDMAHSVHTVEPGARTRGGPRTFAGREVLARGCLSCHVPVAGDVRMGLQDGVQDCTKCHAGHEHLGEGKCVLCHVDRSSPANRDADGSLAFRVNDAGIFDRAKATLKRTPEVVRFDHFSAGHSALAGDRKGDGCAGCHDLAAVDAAQRVLDVPWPGHADRPCLECHVGTRYHR